MTIRTYSSLYKDQPSFVLESAQLRAEFVAHGARMVSLVALAHSFEFLHQQSSPQYALSRYGDPLTPQQAAGFDDMFPTIDPCVYQAAPWSGLPLPDHGELFSIDWQVHVAPHSLSFIGSGVCLPYHFQRTVSFHSPSTLRMDYRVDNLSPSPLFFLWSAHPMLVAPAGTRIVFPPDCISARTVFSSSGRLGAAGDEIHWPLHRDRQGVTHTLDTVRPSALRHREKYFFRHRLHQGWCAAHYPQPGLALTLYFPPETIPHVAVVLNEGWSDPGRSFLLLEPCTAPFDQPTFDQPSTDHSNAHACPPLHHLAPHTHAEWFLNFAVAPLL